MKGGSKTRKLESRNGSSYPGAKTTRGDSGERNTWGKKNRGEKREKGGKVNTLGL